jgi:adenylate cyclase
MTSAPILLNQPNAAAVRAQVERMTASTVFRNSPQLATFLWFIVEAQLRGKGERLKGYTIGVEVLRRDTNFDPQVDPIVRVEATRLRRALERYYVGPGVSDTIMISLPRGGYVPRIGWRTAHDDVEASHKADAASPPKPGLLPGNGMPTLRVAPFVVIGTPQTRAVSLEAIGGKLAEAFALFEIINVLAAAPPQPATRSDYRLDGVIEYRGETVDLRFRLIDESDATVIWSRAFEGVSCTDDCEQIEYDIILRLATTIVQPFGVITANDRAKRLSIGKLDMRYCCVHSMLAIIYARQYFTAFGIRDGDGPPLDRALKAARRGIELRPQSARGYHILFNILFFRGEDEGAIQTAEKAVALNKYDLLILADYGGRLICAGQIDRGMEILNKAVGAGAILPGWHHFYQFVAHHMRGEWVEARYQAAQLTSEPHVYGQLARAIVAHRDGDAVEAERAVKAIVAAEPAWRDNPRHEIGKTITAPDIADRLTADLIATGYLR